MHSKERASFAWMRAFCAGRLRTIFSHQNKSGRGRRPTAVQSVDRQGCVLKYTINVRSRSPIKVGRFNAVANQTALLNRISPAAARGLSGQPTARLRVK